MKSLYEYIDFRKFLEDYYEGEKSRRSSFSYRYFSNKIGFKSKDFIYRVIHKEKKISDASIGKISRALDLPDKETEYFEYLVKFNQADTAAEKNKFYTRLTALREKFARAHHVKLLKDSQYEFFANWYTPILFNLLEVTHFKGDFPELAKLVSPRITAREAKQGVGILLKLDLAQINKKGRYELTHKSLSTKNELHSLGLLNYYIKGTELASAAMANLPRHERNVSGLTVAVSREKYQALTDKINAFREEIAHFVDADDNAERVYQINFQIIPVSQPFKNKGGSGG